MSYKKMNIGFGGTVSRFCKVTSTDIRLQRTSVLAKQPVYISPWTGPALQTIPAGCFRHEDYAGEYLE